MMNKMFLLCAVIVMIVLSAGSAFSEATGKDGFVGVITKSENNKMVGAQIIFANMRTGRPFITYPSGNGAEAIKVFEDDEIVILFFVAEVSGSTETFYINKKKKRFTRVEVGALEATVMDTDFQPIVSHGKIK